MPTSTIEDENNGSENENSSSSEGDDNNDANEFSGVSDDESQPVESADLISTVEFTAPTGKDDKTQDSDKSGSDDDKNGADGEDGDKSGSDIDKTFQDSPRFQELIAQKNEAIQNNQTLQANHDALKEQVSTLTDLVKGLGRGEKEKPAVDPGFKNVLTMTDETIIETFESDPKGFLSNFANQILHAADQRNTTKTEKAQQLSAQQAEENAVNELYAKYENDNPDFVEMWESEEIQAYMEKNPGNTPISAHQMIKAENTQTASAETQQEAIDKAVKAAVAEATKQFKAKSSSRTIKAGPGGGAQQVTNGTPDDLANTKQHGGLTSVLVERSLARERARAGN